MKQGLVLMVALTLLGVGLLVMAQTEMGGADLQRGVDIAQQGAGGAVAACSDCHGDNGAGNEVQAYPMLAGLQAEYLYQQLTAFVKGSRQSQTMMAIASGLTDEEMRDVAAYYASLPAPATASEPADGALLAAGKELFLNGKQTAWDRWMPACELCHGGNAQGAGEVFPPLAGQHASYIKAQLEAWQKGERTNDPNGLMTAVAAQLDDNDIEAVAAYLSHLPTQPDQNSSNRDQTGGLQ